MNEYTSQVIDKVEEAAHLLADSGDVEGAAFFRGMVDGYYRSGVDGCYAADRGSVKVCYNNGYKAGLYSSKWERLPMTVAEAEKV